MKRPASLHSILILSLTILLSSCGVGGGNSVINKAFSVDALISAERPLNSDERNIATRICYAYQSKSKNFRSSDYLGTSFVFQGKKTDCQNILTNYQVNTVLRYDDSNSLYYSPTQIFDSSILFNKKVQTDSSGYLAQLCPKIISNEVINNTTTLAGVKVQISFFRENLDGFLLQYFNKQTDNTYKIDSAEKFKIRSQIDFTTGKIMGMDESYSSQKICPSSYDKAKFSSFEQTFFSR